MEEEAKAQESSTDKNSGQKKPDDQQSDQSTLFIVKILRMFMTCCIPVVQPQTDSPYCTRRNSQCKFPDKCASGKLGPFKQPDEEVLKAFAVVEDEIKQQLVERKGAAPENLTAVGYKEQFVVGVNLFTKVKVDDGAFYVHAKIYQPIQGDPCLLDLSPFKINSDDIEYF